MNTNPFHRPFCTLFVLLFIASAASAQSGVVAAGGTSTGSEFSFSFSLGQPAASSADSASFRLGEGLQQGFSISVERIAQADGMPGVKVYPNPTTGTLLLQRLDASSDETSVEVYSADGRRLRHLVWQSPSLRLDLADLPAGTYLLRLDASTATETLRVVKR